MAAEAWGTPPWEIETAPGGAVWMARFSTLRELQSIVSQSGGSDDEGFEDI